MKQLLLLFPLLFLLVACDKQEPPTEEIYVITEEPRTDGIWHVRTPITLENDSPHTVLLNGNPLGSSITLVEEGAYVLEWVPWEEPSYHMTIVVDVTPPEVEQDAPYVTCDVSNLSFRDSLSSEVLLLYRGDLQDSEALENLPFGRLPLTLVDEAGNETELVVHHIPCDSLWVSTEQWVLPLIGVALMVLFVFIEKEVRS